MRSVFEVTLPAANPSLLTAEQLRLAAGLAVNDASRDAELATIGARISAEVHRACRLRSDVAHPPTLRRENIRETFRETGRETTLFLSRQFLAGPITVTEAGIALAASDIVVEAEAGMVHRIAGHRDVRWQCGNVIVEYTAGFAEVPGDLVGIAMDLVRLRLSEAKADPLERATSIEIPDVETRRVERWVGAVPGSTAGPVPADMLARLGAYARPVVA